MLDILQSIFHKVARLVFLKYKTDHILLRFSALNTSVASLYPLTWLCLPLQPHLLIFIPSLPSSFPLPVPATLPISLPLNTPGSFLRQVFALTISFTSRALLLLVELLFTLSHYCLLLNSGLQVSTQMPSSSRTQVPSTILPYFIFFISLCSWNCVFICLHIYYLSLPHLECNHLGQRRSLLTSALYFFASNSAWCTVNNQ